MQNRLLTPVAIVQAQPSDIEAIVAMLEEVAEWMVARGIDQWYPGGFRNPHFQQSVAEHVSLGEVYLARVEDQLASMVMVQRPGKVDQTIWGEETDLEVASYIHRLVVRRAFANLGLGRYVLQWAEQKIAADGKRYTRLDCSASNQVLRDYYECAGYSYRGEVQGKTWSAARYEKKLD